MTTSMPWKICANGLPFLEYKRESTALYFIYLLFLSYFFPSAAGTCLYIVGALGCLWLDTVQRGGYVVPGYVSVCVERYYVILWLYPSLVVLLPLISALDCYIMTDCALSCGCFGQGSANVALAPYNFYYHCLGLTSRGHLCQHYLEVDPTEGPPRLWQNSHF